MHRCDFLALLASALVAWPLAAGAEPSNRVIGFLHPASPAPFARLVGAFREGLKETGFVEGENLQIEYRWAQGHEDRLKGLAADLVNHPVEVIVAAGGSFVAQAARSASSTLPIVFVLGGDPIQLGLVTSLNRPGGNVTGVTLESTDMLPKRLELLRELVPGTRVAMLRGFGPLVQAFESEFVERYGLAALKLNPDKGVDEFEDRLDASVKDSTRALIISADPFFMNWRTTIVSVAAKHAMPTIYPWREYTAAGGFASYGPSIADAYRQSGRYAGRILMGAKPSDLPVQRPTTFDMVINLKTAKSLGLTIPRIMLLRANELID